MIIVKIILKIAAIPLIAMLTLIKWVMLFFTSLSAWIIYMLAMIFFLTGVLSYGFGLETGQEVVRILATSFVVFMIPHVAEGIIIEIALIGCRLSDFVWS